MKNSPKKTRTTGPPRLRFPGDEARYHWLPLLLEGLALFDRATDLSVRRAKRKQGRPVACREGCGSCCRVNTDIPVYPLEMAGIYWYAIEKTKGPARELLSTRLDAHAGSPPCPFLEDDSCSIYPLRPGACRLFIVFGRPCAPGEDAYHCRREDVLTPIQEITDEAFHVMLPFYGITTDEARRQAIQNRVIHARVQNLLSADWRNLARKMLEYDERNRDKEDQSCPG